uniref:Uncharacterized protein n=1 Tax=Arundo donax TaxID=35708 RepID=A0A0A9BA76_ARUDO
MHLVSIPLWLASRSMSLHVFCLKFKFFEWRPKYARAYAFYH